MQFQPHAPTIEISLWHCIPLCWGRLQTPPWRPSRSWICVDSKGSDALPSKLERIHMLCSKDPCRPLDCHVYAQAQSSSYGVARPFQDHSSSQHHYPIQNGLNNNTPKTFACKQGTGRSHWTHGAIPGWVYEVCNASPNGLKKKWTSTSGPELGTCQDHEYHDRFPCVACPHCYPTDLTSLWIGEYVWH